MLFTLDVLGKEYNSTVLEQTSKARNACNHRSIEWISSGEAGSTGTAEKLGYVITLSFRYTGWAKLSDTTLHFCL